MKSTKFIFNLLLIASLLFVYACGGNTETTTQDENVAAVVETNPATTLLD